jgi:hypothetical protein
MKSWDLKKLGGVEGERVRKEGGRNWKEWEENGIRKECGGVRRRREGVMEGLERWRGTGDSNLRG